MHSPDHSSDCFSTPLPSDLSWPDSQWRRSGSFTFSTAPRRTSIHSRKDYSVADIASFSWYGPSADYNARASSVCVNFAIVSRYAPRADNQGILNFANSLPPRPGRARGSPQRALHAALRMQEELRRYSAKVVADGSTPIQIVRRSTSWMLCIDYYEIG